VGILKTCSHEYCPRSDLAAEADTTGYSRGAGVATYVCRRCRAMQVVPRDGIEPPRRGFQFDVVYP